jgi:aminodeoxyfutalosine deaminase
VVVSYAQEAASHGAVYIEGIFTPIERTSGGASWDEVFSGFCDGAIEARELFGVEVRLTTDIPRILGPDEALETARYALKYRDRGIVGLGLGGPEASFPPEPFEVAFRLAKDGGLGSVPHAGEAAGPESIRGAMDVLQADRIRHGIRAVEDEGLLQELAARSIVCDVCPVSNLRTRVVESMETHPLPQLLAAGVLCSISTDDPAMFDTDLTRDYEVAAQLGCSPERAFRAGVAGALCDADTRSRLEQVQERFAWPDYAAPRSEE